LLFFHLLVTMAAKGTMMPSKAVEAITNNDPAHTHINLGGNSSFQMNPAKYASDIFKAMVANTSVTDLDLSNCGIPTGNASEIAEMIRQNKTLKVLNLSKNKISSEGIEEILAALKDNASIVELNLLDAGPSRLGEGALSALCTSLETNVTLIKVIWRLDSRQAWKITKFLSRNMEIERRIAQGKPVDDIHPAFKKDADPATVAREEKEAAERAAAAAYR
jgi:hypothetical protein